MALIPYEKVPEDRDPPLLLDGEPVRELYCGDPRCDCLTGHLVVAGVPVVIDVGTGRLDFLDRQTAVLKEAIGRKLAALVQEPGVIDHLRAHYLAVRRYGLEHHYEHVDWTEARPGDAVPWTAVFPGESVVMLPILKEPKAPTEGQVVPEYSDEDVAFHLGLSDAYCVDSRCDCQRVLWDVAALVPGEENQVRPLGAVIYDFRKRQPSVQHVQPGIDADQLLYTVLTALHSFPGILEEHAGRYRRLRQLLIPLIQRQRRQKQARPVREVGRNDPCPCGSGKKYKRCHGQNEPSAQAKGAAKGLR